MSKTEKRKIGDTGENIAARFLRSKGFVIIGKNYLKPWGEIDIIVQKKGKIHFVEVKTVLTKNNKNVTRETLDHPLRKIYVFLKETFLPEERLYLIREASQEERRGASDEYRPEDNLHPWKLGRLKRVIHSYLEEKRVSEEGDWQFDAVTVQIDEIKKIAEVEYLEDIIL